MQKITLTYRVTVITLAFLQNSLLAGLLFGWASISGSLLISDTENGGPGLTALYVHNMFVVAAFFSMLGPLTMGIFLDRWGPRASSLISITFEGVGFALFGASNAETFPYFIPAMCMIAIGGPGVLNATIHLSNLFPAWRATATACMTGSFQISFLIFLLFDELWSNYNISYQLLFTGYCGICIANAIVSLAVWPDIPFDANEVEAILVAHHGGTPRTKDHHEFLRAITLPDTFIYRPRLIRRASSFSSFHSVHSHHSHHSARSLEEGRKRHSFDDATKHANAHSQSNSNLGVYVHNIDTHVTLNDTKRRRSFEGTKAPPLPPTVVDIKDKSFFEQMTSIEFISLTLLFIVVTFWANFYIGNFGIQLGDSQLISDVTEQQNYCQLFTIIMTAGVVVIPVIGALMDWIGFTWTSAITIGFGIAWSGLLLVPNKYALLISFFVYTCFRTSFFAFVFAYIADTLGFKYFGILSGVVFLAGGIAGTLQYPLSLYATGTCHLDIASEAETCNPGNWVIVNCAQALSLVLCLSFCYVDFITRKKRSELIANSRPNSRCSSRASLSRRGSHSEPNETTPLRARSRSGSGGRASEMINMGHNYSAIKSDNDGFHLASAIN